MNSLYRSCILVFSCTQLAVAMKTSNLTTALTGRLPGSKPFAALVSGQLDQVLKSSGTALEQNAVPTIPLPTTFLLSYVGVVNLSSPDAQFEFKKVYMSQRGKNIEGWNATSIPKLHKITDRTELQTAVSFADKNASSLIEKIMEIEIGGGLQIQSLKPTVADIWVEFYKSEEGFDHMVAFVACD